MRIAIGCDHGGFELAEALRAHLREQDAEIKDFGTHSTDSVDYPSIAAQVARAVTGGEADFGGGLYQRALCPSDPQRQ